MKQTFQLSGLDCANCAAKLESALNALEPVKAASVDFMKQRLVLEADDGRMEEAVESARGAIRKVEPGVTMLAGAKGPQSSPPKAACGCGHDHSRDLEQAHRHDQPDGPGAADCGCGHTHGADHVHEHADCGCARGHADAARQGTGDAHPSDDGWEEDEYEDDEPERKPLMSDYTRTQVVRIAGALIIMVAGMLLPQLKSSTELLMFLIAYLLIGADVLWKALRNIVRGKVFDENFLMSLATVGAFCIGDYAEGVAVMLFYQIGETFQTYAVNRSRRSISELMDIRPDYANVMRGGELVQVAPEDVAVGDEIIVRAGERIPLDGTVLEGTSAVDTSALTGESMPRDVAEGADVLSGCINLSGVLRVKVAKVFGESTVSKILDLVENASSKKAGAENFITKFARYYTPAVVIVAALLAVLPPLLLSQPFAEWINRALVFLVISCPCALVISVPMSFFGGIGGASRCGVLVKGSNYLEALADAEIVVFDKTGTLTQGKFTVTERHPSGRGADELLELVSYAEAYSSHPISLSIKAAYGKTLDNSRVGEVEEISGRGVKALVDGRTVLAGNLRLMEQHRIAVDAPAAVGTVVYAAVDGVYAGCLVIADQAKEDARQAIIDLKAGRVRKTVMLTGDAKPVGEAVARELGLDQVYTELLPDGKVEKLEELMREKTGRGKLLFVGDGINDAPVLARADVGIAMGGLGSDAAIEAADVVVMTDQPSRVATAMKISRKTLGIVRQNVIFALAVKLIVLVLGAFGIATMWEAVFADVGVAVIAILNAMRALNVKKLQ